MNRTNRYANLIKNIITLTIVLFSIHSFGTMTSYGQNVGKVMNGGDNEKVRKTAQKEAKKTAKELKKDGWTYSGAMSLEGSLTDYYLKSENFGGQCDTRFYTVNNVPSLRNGELQLLTTAQNEYAQENEAILLGKVTDHSGTDETTLRNSVIKMSAILKGDVKKCFTLYKRNSNGSYDMCGYFLIDIISANKKINKIAKDLEMGNLIEEAAVEK